MRCQYQTHEHATRGAIDYIERFYNPVRLHFALDYLSPNRFEELLTLEYKNSSLEICPVGAILRSLTMSMDSTSVLSAP